MSEFLSAILAFPTVVFTIVMGVVLTYWLFVILGAVGIDMLDGHLDFESGAKAASGALQGGLKAAGGALEGGAKAAGGALEGGVKAAAAHDHAADVDGGILAALGFAGIPLTVSVSLVGFLSWTLSLLSAGPIHSALEGRLPSWLVSGTLGLVCFVAALALSGLAVRPLRPVFVARRAPGREELMGRVCNISSGSVTDRHGHATFEDGGAGLILNVICSKANALKRGDPALILGYDAERDAYDVEPVDWLLPEELKQLEDPAKAVGIARARARH